MERSARTACSTRIRCRPSARASTRRRQAASPAWARPSRQRRHHQILAQPPRRQTRPPLPYRLPRTDGIMTDTATAATCARLHAVSKLFGSFAALRQVSAELESGRCYVLIGENGAGKSTLLRILAGLLRPSMGTVRVFGDVEPHHARARIGYMSHAPMLYDELTGVENLRYFASLYLGRA